MKEKEWLTRDWTTGQLNALVKKIGEEDARAILRGEKIAVIEDVPFVELFDKNGRRIPPRGLKAAVCDANRNFYLKQPKLETVEDYANRLVRFQEAFHPGPCMSAAEFQGRAKELLEQLEKDERLRNLLKGVHLPVIVPELEAKDFDYGQVLEEVFLAAVGWAYQREFPGRKFNNYRQGELAGRVNIIEGSRHDQLIAKMRQGPVVGICFPNPLQGYSILADREQMTTLPQKLLLNGGFDTAAAEVGYPDILARDFNTPGQDCAALSWRSAWCSLVFGAGGDWFGFALTGGLAVARDHYSGGLAFFG